MDRYVPPTGLPFGKGSMAWKVNMEPVIGLGGGRALLLQVLHPLIAAGVEQHSNFVEDPFRRGFRTADTMLKLAFAEPSISKRRAKHLHQIHERVKGVSREGVGYDALDPDLLIWVWATLVEVSLRVYESAVGPLTDLERQRYYEEQKLIAYACGVPNGGCPKTYDDFLVYFETTIDERLHVTRTARLVAYAGKHPPLPWPLGPVAGAVGTFLTVGLLPDRFRGDLGYTWTPRQDRLLTFAFSASRALAKVVPRPARHVLNRYLTNRKRPLGWWRNRSVKIPDELSSAP